MKKPPTDVWRLFSLAKLTGQFLGIIVQEIPKSCFVLNI